jgi:hypothetical protein
LKFEEWSRVNAGRPYVDILSEIIKVDDDVEFRKWACAERLNEFRAPDWAMLAIYCLNERIEALEEKQKKDKK